MALVVEEEELFVGAGGGGVKCLVATEGSDALWSLPVLGGNAGGGFFGRAPGMPPAPAIGALGGFDWAAPTSLPPAVVELIDDLADPVPVPPPTFPTVAGRFSFGNVVTSLMNTPLTLPGCSLARDAYTSKSASPESPTNRNLAEGNSFISEPIRPFFLDPAASNMLVRIEPYSFRLTEPVAPQQLVSRVCGGEEGKGGPEGKPAMER